MGEKRELWVVALGSSVSQPGNYALVLEDAQSQVRIPLVIGKPEAQAIAIAMEGMSPARLITHDLFKNVLLALGTSLKEVLLCRLEAGVFQAELALQTADGELLRLDARPSDAIALAVRFDAPIYAYQAVIEAASLSPEAFRVEGKRGSLEHYSVPELEELLQKILAKEDYESASRIRDYLERRKNNGG